jgi:uncharacterized protein
MTTVALLCALFVVAQSTPVETPAGFIRVKVLGVMPTEQGKVVVLVPQGLTERQDTMLPIWIGDTEALSIQLRLEHKQYERPLTHDLFDAVLRDFGATLVKVHVDELRGKTFIGTVFLSHDNKVHEYDARPSDAIALALGNDAPIFVSKAVLRRAGITHEKQKSPPALPPAQPEPDSVKPSPSISPPPTPNTPRVPPSHTGSPLTPA